jgi:hypothetical protein
VCILVARDSLQPFRAALHLVISREVSSLSWKGKLMGLLSIIGFILLLLSLIRSV